MLETAAVEKPQRRSKDNGGGRETTTAVWAALMGVSVGEAWLCRDEPKAPDLQARFDAAMTALARGVPFAYAVRRAGFRTLDLAIDRRALIPRPETEGLVELVLRELGKRERGSENRGLAADLGAGSGCIALALAVEGNFARVVAVERSREAAALARENVARIGAATPVDVYEGDWLAPLRGMRCRAIVSNPPYLSAADYADLDRSVAEFEPRDALVSGADGLDATRALLAGARSLLEPDGLLALEIDERRADAVRAVAREHRWCDVTIHDDLFGRPRYALAFPGSREGEG